MADYSLKFNTQAVNLLKKQAIKTRKHLYSAYLHQVGTSENFGFFLSMSSDKAHASGVPFFLFFFFFFFLSPDFHL